MAKHTDFGEIMDLIKEARAIQAGDFIEPDTELQTGAGHHLIATVHHQDVKQLYTLMMRRVNQLNELQDKIEQAGGLENVPEASLEEGQNALFELDLAREMFFLTLFKRYATDDTESVGIAEGWQVYWQEKQVQQFNLPPGMIMIDPNMFQDFEDDEDDD